MIFQKRRKGFNFHGHLYSAIAIILLAVFLRLNYDAFSALFPPFDFWIYGISVFLFIVYTLIPDIDTNSVIENYYFSFVLAVVAGLLVSKKYTIAAIVGGLSILPKLAKHRGWTHSLWFGALISAPFAYFHWVFAVSAFSGFVLHKIGDAF